MSFCFIVVVFLFFFKGRWRLLGEDKVVEITHTHTHCLCDWVGHSTTFLLLVIIRQSDVRACSFVFFSLLFFLLSTERRSKGSFCDSSFCCCLSF